MGRTARGRWRPHGSSLVVAPLLETSIKFNPVVTRHVQGNNALVHTLAAFAVAEREGIPPADGVFGGILSCQRCFQMREQLLLGFRHGTEALIGEIEITTLTDMPAYKDLVGIELIIKHRLFQIRDIKRNRRVVGNKDGGFSKERLERFRSPWATHLHAAWDAEANTAT